MGDHGSLSHKFNLFSFHNLIMMAMMIGMVLPMLPASPTLGNLVVGLLKSTGSSLVDLFQHGGALVDIAQNALNGNFMPVDGGAMVAAGGMAHGGAVAVAAKAVSLKGTWLASSAPAAVQAKFLALSPTDWADFRGLSDTIQHGIVGQLDMYESSGLPLPEVIRSFCPQ